MFERTFDVAEPVSLSKLTIVTLRVQPRMHCSSKICFLDQQQRFFQ